MRNEAAHSVSDDFDLMDASIGPRIEKLNVVRDTGIQNLRRYSLPDTAVPDGGKGSGRARAKMLKESKARLEGYVKYHKSMFALGINAVAYEIETGQTTDSLKRTIEEAKRLLASVQEKKKSSSV